VTMLPSAIRSRRPGSGPSSTSTASGRRFRPNFRTTFEKIEPEQGDSDIAVV
jgi:hypothetical protein